ncbi:MAG: hypothetical protein GEU97_24305 [Actinophytocola sp.]|nr:hypothetical protein [Actinophytocola sp.]
MRQYELIFAVDELSDATVTAVYESFDALYARHGDTFLFTVTQDGESAQDAATRAVGSLEEQGVRIQRLCEDFVDRGDIAERAGTTVQAVGQWIRRDRLKNAPFPEPYSFVSGGIWLWGDVNDWLRRVGKDADEQHYPGWQDVAEVNTWLTTRLADNAFA